MVAIRDLVADPDLLDLFVFEPEKRFIRRADGSGNERIYEEYHHGDDFWNIRVSIQPDIIDCTHYSLDGGRRCSRKGYQLSRGHSVCRRDAADRIWQ
jgi:hypothetical protein